MLKRFFSVFLMCLCVFATNINFAHGDAYECGTSENDECFFYTNNGVFEPDPGYVGEGDNKYICQSVSGRPNYNRQAIPAGTLINNDAVTGYACSCSGEYGLDENDDCIKCSDLFRTLISGNYNNTCGGCDENHGYISDGNGHCQCKDASGWVYDGNANTCTCSGDGYAYPEDGYCIECPSHSVVVVNGGTTECKCDTGYETLYSQHTYSCKCDKQQGYGILVNNSADKDKCVKCEDRGEGYELKTENGESKCKLKTGYSEDGCQEGYGSGRDDNGEYVQCLKCDDQDSIYQGEGFVPVDGVCKCADDGYAEGTSGLCQKCSNKGVGWIANSDHSACECDRNNGYELVGGQCKCTRAGFGLDNNNKCKSCSDMGPGLVSDNSRTDENQCICGASGYGVKTVEVGGPSVCTLCPLNSYSVKDNKEGAPDNQRECTSCEENKTSAVGSNNNSDCKAYSTGTCSFAGINKACNVGTYSPSGMECSTKRGTKFYFPIDSDSVYHQINGTVDATKWLQKHRVNQGVDVRSLNDGMTDALDNLCNGIEVKIKQQLNISGDVFSISGNSVTDIINILENYKNRKLSDDTEKYYVDMWISYIWEYRDKGRQIQRLIECDIDSLDLDVYDIGQYGQCLACPAGQTTTGVKKGKCDSIASIDQYCIGSYCFSLNSPAITIGKLSNGVQTDIMSGQTSQNSQSDETGD